MKKFLLPIISLITLIVSPGLYAQVGNGNFSADPIGTSGTDNSNAITDWRLYNVTGIAGLANATVVAGPTVGSQAVAITINNNGYAAQGGFGFDNFNNQTPITFGKTYTFSFQMSGVVGDEVSTDLAEFSDPNTFAGQETKSVIFIAAAGYQTYSFSFTPKANTATSVDIGFYPSDRSAVPDRGNVTTQTDTITNVSLNVPEPGSVALLATAGVAVLGWFFAKKKQAA